MGSNAFYREERPARFESVDGYWIDRYPVTNAEFRCFVDATGFITFSERVPLAEMYPDATPELLVPGSLVFVKPRHPVSLRDHRAWWAYVPGANWRQPNGPDSSIALKDTHPVVHVTHEDTRAYAAWVGKELPTEVEWEFAARGGLEGATYPWGDAANPEGRFMANTWQGLFPFENLVEDGVPKELRRSMPSRQMGMGFTTWWATSGSGRSVHSRQTAAPKSHAVIAMIWIPVAR